MKEEHEKLRAKYLTEYIYEKHNQDKCLGFIDGFEKAIQALSQSEWIRVEDRLPDELETVWITNGKGWTTLGCRVCFSDSWHWAETNGVIYQERGKIVSECESDDLDVKFWHYLPQPPQTKEP